MVENTVRRTIEENGLLCKGDHVVIGLSGGPDSVCLFDVLLGLADQLELTIHPVHLNHLFRPGDAERDQQYVEDLCKSHDLTCRSFVVDCNALAKELGMTSEEAGRKARYDAFYQVAQEVAEELAKGSAEEEGCGEVAVTGADQSRAAEDRVKIAVAQNANDQAETILLRLLRGTGTDGLAGIAYQRYEMRQIEQDGQAKKLGFKVIRPLLDVYRNEIEEYCEEHGLNPVIDHTNNEGIYTRNKVRLDLIPRLSEYNENILEGLVRLGRIASDDKDYFWQATEKAFTQLREKASTQLREEADQRTAKQKASEESSVAARDNQEDDAGEIILDRQGLADLHPAIRHRVVQKAFGMVGLEKDITAERLAAADAIILKKQGPKTVEFPHGYKITVAKGLVTFTR